MEDEYDRKIKRKYRQKISLEGRKRSRLYQKKQERINNLDLGSLYYLSLFTPYKSSRFSRKNVCYPATQNMVCLCILEDENKKNEGSEESNVIDLSKFCGIMGTCSFPQPDFPAVTIRGEQPSCQLFRTLKMMIMGASSMHCVLFFIHKLNMILMSMGIKPKISKIVLCNKVCNANVGHCIDTDNFEGDQLSTVSKLTSFPAVLYVVKLLRPDGELLEATLLIFASGNVNIMGLKNDSNTVQYIFHAALPVLRANKATGKMMTIHQKSSKLAKIKRIMSTRPPDELQCLLQNAEENIEEIAQLLERIAK